MGIVVFCFSCFSGRLRKWLGVLGEPDSPRLLKHGVYAVNYKHAPSAYADGACLVCLPGLPTD
jgi:hypothetical protein